MKTSTLGLRATLIAMVISCVIGCTYSRTSIKGPNFKGSFEQLLASIGKIVAFESVSIDGTETMKNGVSTSELTINVINGKNIPAEDSLAGKLAFAIATDLKKTLTDPSQFDNYNVKFVQRIKSDGKTTSNWSAFRFQSKDMKIVD